ncbi:MAG: anthranilate phosphoribosyltransferase [Candidatus Bathyarchaeia archaeon]
MLREAIEKLVNGQNLSSREAYECMVEIMSGKASEAQIAAFLVALRVKGETVEEIAAFASAMRSFCHGIKPNVKGRLVDTCGTGGDKIKTFNVSTAAAFVVAGAGVPVAKHGNRSVTSRSGSADVLECLGLNLEVPPKRVEEAIEHVGIGFMFAPAFHPAMKYVAPVRREIGIRTVFNILGPLANPANANAQLIGVYDPRLVEKIAQTLMELGLEEAMVVHGADGLDEISTFGKTYIAWLRNGAVKCLEVTPETLGVKRAAVEKLMVSNTHESAEIIFKVLYGCIEPGDPEWDIVAVNAAAGIIVGGKADEFAYGLELARESIENGEAYKKLKELVKFCGGSTARLEEFEEKYG